MSNKHRDRLICPICGAHRFTDLKGLRAHQRAKRHLGALPNDESEEEARMRRALQRYHQDKVAQC
jgi:hypothetical protein